MIAKCVIEDGKISQVGYIPCQINEKKQPEVLKNDEKGHKHLNLWIRSPKGQN